MNNVIFTTTSNRNEWTSSSSCLKSNWDIEQILEKSCNQVNVHHFWHLSSDLYFTEPDNDGILSTFTVLFKMNRVWLNQGEIA